MVGLSDVEEDTREVGATGTVTVIVTVATYRNAR